MTTANRAQAVQDRLTTDRPLYRFIEEDLLRQITEGELEAGQAIPPERELCKCYGVSRITVRQAVRELETRGYVQRKQGKGTFVSRSRIQREIGWLVSFSEEMKLQGRVPGSRLLNLQHKPADKLIAAQLHVEEGEPVWTVERLRLADGELVAISTSYLHLPPEIYLTPMELTTEVSLWAVLAKKGINVVEGEATVRAGIADAHYARLLGIAEGDALLLREGLNYTLTETPVPVEAFQIISRGDHYQYSLHLIRQALR